jgi:nitronate monooxygenase
MHVMNDLMIRLGLAFPIIQAPMAGGVTTVELVAEVAQAGGLGSIGAAYLTPEIIRINASAIRARTNGAFAINLFADTQDRPATTEEIAYTRELLRPWAEAYGVEPPAAPSPPLALDRQIEAMLEACPAVFSFTFGLMPADLLEACRARNIFIMGTATTLEEVVALEQSGVDCICVQGMEAGGHRGTFLKAPEDSLVGLISLLGMAVQATSLPVIAAGGIMNGQGVRAVLDLGASAASLGTAFMVTDEAGTPPAHQHMLAEAEPRPTVLTRAFSGRLARGLTNRFHESLHPHQNRLVPFPALNDMTRKIRQAAGNAHDPEALSLWAGQAYPLVRPMSAAQLMATLVSEAQL